LILHEIFQAKNFSIFGGETACKRTQAAFLAGKKALLVELKLLIPRKIPRAKNFARFGGLRWRA
jgi:hypothetical protein